MSEDQVHTTVSAEIMGVTVSAVIRPEMYSISLSDPSGHPEIIDELSRFMTFLSSVQMSWKALRDVTVSADEAQPPLSSEICDTDDDEGYEEGCGCGGFEYCPRCFPDTRPSEYRPSNDDTEEPAPEWTEAATEEDLQVQSADSYDLFDDYWEDEDGFWQDGYYYRY